MNRTCKAASLIFGLALQGTVALAQAPDGFSGRTFTCEEMRKHPAEVFSGDVYLKSGVFRPIRYDRCEESLESRPFLRRLFRLTEVIHGPFCQGNAYDLSMDYGFNLMKAGFAPSLFLRQAEQAEAVAASDELEYFEEWSLRSFSNFRLHEAFLAEYGKALPRLTEYYRRRFRLPEAKAEAVARHALRLLANRAFGAFPSRDRIEAPSRLVRLSMEGKSTVADLRTALAATPSPGQEEIDRALKVALLHGKPRPYLSLLMEPLETLNAGDESTVFFALGNPGNVKFLLERGAAVDHSNGFGKTPLFYAIELGEPALVELLLDHGADVNHPYRKTAELETAPCPKATVRSGRTPLMHAAQHGGVRMLALLVKRGVRLGDVDERGSNALDYAVASHRPANAAFLKSLGMRSR